MQKRHANKKRKDKPSTSSLSKKADRLLSKNKKHLKKKGWEEIEIQDKFNAREHWKGMPEFVQNDLKPYQRVVINLVDEAAALKFFKLIGQKFTKKTRSVWFPEVDEETYMNKRYTDKQKTK